MNNNKQSTCLKCSYDTKYDVILLTFLLIIFSAGIYINDVEIFPAIGQTNQEKSSNNSQIVAESKETLNKETVAAVNQIPGVKIAPEALESPQLPPIRGFHPIKRVLRPMEDLQNISIQLEQQIMKLNGPIAALQPSMLGLQKKMTGVSKGMGIMDDQLTQVQNQVNGVHTDITAVRSNLATMSTDLAAMRKQMNQLVQPLEQLKQPLIGVAEPLLGVQKRLDQLQNLLATVLLAILIASVAVAVGTPIAAIIIYRNRKKLFPDLKDNELPTIKH